MPGAGAATRSAAGSTVRYAMVMNFPSAISSTTTSFARARKSRGLRVLARERPEDELRHRHVGGRIDAVPGDVPEHDGEPAVGELEEVVDVAADVDPRRRLVDACPTSSPATAGSSRGQQRALHRLGELLLLLVEACVVDRERGLPATVQRRGEHFLGDRLGRVERHDRQLGEQLARRRRSGAPPRSSPARGTARAARTSRRVARGRCGSSNRGSRAPRPARLRPLEDRPTAARVERASATCTALRRRARRRARRARGSRPRRPELLDDRRRRSRRASFERQRLRERARDLVQRDEPTRRLALELERVVERSRRGVATARAAARSGPRPRAARRARRAARARSPRSRARPARRRAARSARRGPATARRRPTARPPRRAPRARRRAPARRPRRRASHDAPRARSGPSTPRAARARRPRVPPASAAAGRGQSGSSSRR